jgi:PBSX family phage terminase large subunit
LIVLPRYRSLIDKATEELRSHVQRTYDSLPDLDLLKHQQTFVSDTTTRHLAISSGVGAGKSYGLAVKCLDLALKNQGFMGMILSPSMTLARDSIMVQFEDLLNDCGIQYDFKLSPLPQYVLHLNKPTKIVVRSFENRTLSRIRAVNAAFACIDELEALPYNKARLAYQLIQGRIRVGNVNQIAIATTPDQGKTGFLYKNWVKTPQKRSRLIRARTQDNHHLPDTFIDDLLETYPANLVQLYLEGEFVSLNSAGLVVYNYDETLHHTDYRIPEFTPNTPYDLHIGIDFNVNKGAAAIGVKFHDRLIVADEIYNSRDTPDTIKTLKHYYGDVIEAGRAFVYPDASGKARKSVNANESDISLLRDAGFKVRSRNSNPAVKDRHASLNAAFLNAKNETRLYVNTKMAPNLADCLMAFYYNEDGNPDKPSGEDISHSVDALGYLNFWFHPIKSPSLGPSVKSMPLY